jgi:hypothetical protein
VQLILFIVIGVLVLMNLFWIVRAIVG